MNRVEIADIIVFKIEHNIDYLKKEFKKSAAGIGYFFVDDLLPYELATQLAGKFPSSDQMVLKKSLREDKFIGVQMNQYDTLLEEIIYAFQDERIVRLISEITELQHIFPDEKLYAGGISLMKKKSVFKSAFR